MPENLKKPFKTLHCGMAFAEIAVTLLKRAAAPAAQRREKLIVHADGVIENGFLRVGDQAPLVFFLQT